MRNLARTTPELPVAEHIVRFEHTIKRTDPSHTVRAGDLAPDHPDVGAADLTLGPVNESDLLAQVEVGSLDVINTLNLDQTISHIRFRSCPVWFRGIGTWCWG